MHLVLAQDLKIIKICKLGIFKGFQDVFDSGLAVILKCWCFLVIYYLCQYLIMVITQYTIEEKVIERAYKKLALDALVIQQGRLAEQKSKGFLGFIFVFIILLQDWWII